MTSFQNLPIQPDLAAAGAIIAIVIVVIVLAVLAVLALVLVGIYNGLVRSREKVNTEWAQVETLLKRRHDLIPNLVETVKGYASHEQETLQNVIAARSAATGASGVQETMAAENALSGALRQLFAVSEAYPDLKANSNFQQLQSELTNTENGIARQRQTYHDTVNELNTKVETFPTNLIAGPFGFEKKPYFEVTTEAEREAPKVSFS